MHIVTAPSRVRRSICATLLIVAITSGACSIGVMAQTPTPLTGGAVSSAVAPGVTAATLQPTIAGGSANLPAGSQTTSGRPHGITVLLVIVVVALIVLGGGFTFNRRRDQRLP
ncbi:MAG: hypothetical protein M3Y58_07600 [Chloroflexota bacterium]|nr:hypothetical protein [Chloroflexota bacterium]